MERVLGLQMTMSNLTNLRMRARMMKALTLMNPHYKAKIRPISVTSFGRQVVWHWNKHKQRIEHEYAISGWALGIIEDVRKDVLERLTGTHCDAVEKFVSQLHLPPCPNTNPAVLSVFARDH